MWPFKKRPKKEKYQFPVPKGTYDILPIPPGNKNWILPEIDETPRKIKNK
jgi:hypothetical protein